MQATFISLRSIVHTFHVGGMHSFLMSEPSSVTWHYPECTQIIPCLGHAWGNLSRFVYVRFVLEAAQ
jgi:hypothetical protein